MIERIKGITIEGRCFDNNTTLKLYPKSNDRISIVYGKNGSGKSTISMGVQNLALPIPNSDITVKLLDEEDNLLDTEDYKDKVYVFNEQYIDKNVKIDDDGLGTIILFGAQVDIQADIEKHTILKEKLYDDLQISKAKLVEYKTRSNIISPEYYLDQIRKELKKSGGWSETDSRIKGSKQNSPVRDELLFEICKLKPSASIEILKKEFDSKKVLLDKVSDLSISFPILTRKQVLFESGMEKKICTLLSKTLDKPDLTDREKLILEAIQSGKQMMVEESKDIFSDNLTEVCPYCYQAVTSQYKEALVASINRVINKDVEDHKAELKAISFPLIEEDYTKYEDLAPSVVKNINSQKAKCLALISTYIEHIRQKIENIYTPVLIEVKGLENEIIELNALLKLLEEKISEFDDAVKRREKLINELVLLNKEIAHFAVVGIYENYNKQLKEKEAQDEKVANEYKDYKSEVQILENLQAQKANIGLAISRINDALEYVFFSKDRLSIELRDKKYYLKSNGKDVRPKNISLGERNIVALCYFFTQMMSNRELEQFYKNESFIVIDDPVSSFDFENRVGILSYIRYQVDCVIKGNQQSKVLILTHDLTTAFDLRKVMEEISDSTKGIANIQKTSWIHLELKNKKLEVFNKSRNEYEHLLHMIYKYANGESEDFGMYIGNVMRRALETFSTFNYKKGIIEISYDKNILSVLGDRSLYFNNLMYRLVLNGESHYEEQVYSLHDDTNFFKFISDDEKKRTAKDILCFMYLLNSAHIQSYFQSISKAADNIKQWCARISSNSSFTTTVPPKQKRKIKLYDCLLSAGLGNDIDSEVQYEEYYTYETNCDFALKISGDSMEPDILDKSVVLVKKCDYVNEGDIGAFYYDGVVYCKRLIKMDGELYLESINTKYKPIKIVPENFLKVYGVVVGIE